MTTPAATAAGAASVAGTADAFYALLSALAANTARLAGDAWDELDPSDLLRSWLRLDMPDRLRVATEVAQRTAAASAADYVQDALDAQRRPTGDGEFMVPDSLVGVSSDGRDLDGLLLSPLTRSLEQLGRGEDGERAKTAGRDALTTIVSTQVADAGRAATAVAMTADPRATGFVRMLRLPSCGRCAVLAGRRYRVSSGFQRHPN